MLQNMVSNLKYIVIELYVNFCLIGKLKIIKELITLNSN